MLTAAARSFLITTSLICSAALLSACGGDTTHEEEHHHSETSSSATEQVHSSSSEAPSNKPDAFSFEDQEGVEPGIEVTSEPVEIQGLDDPVAIEITGGYYAINSQEDEAFTDQPGEIEAGDQLTLRTQAPANGSQVQEVTVIIGGVSGLWRVSTPEDTEAPQAAFAFPTPMTATDAETLTLRGTASDELSQVDAVTVTVEGEGGTEIYTAESDDGFATWTVEVSLAPGDNQIQLGAEDVLGNANDDVARITVRRQSFDLAFPDNESPFVGIQDMTFDHENGRLLVAELDPSHSPTGSVRSIDLTTGKREKWASGEASHDRLAFSYVESIEMDYKRNRVLLGPTEGELVAIDLESGERELLAGPGVPSDDEPTFRSPQSILIDPENDDYAYVLSGGAASDYRLVRVNLETGERSIVVGGDLTLINNLRSVVIGPDSRFVFVTRTGDNPILTIDMVTGEHEELDMEAYPNSRFDGIYIADMASISGRNKFYVATEYEGLMLYDIDSGTFETAATFSYNNHFEQMMFPRISLDEDNQRLFLMDSDTLAVISVDLITQEYVLISKSVD